MRDGGCLLAVNMTATRKLSKYRRGTKWQDRVSVNSEILCIHPTCVPVSVHLFYFEGK